MSDEPQQGTGENRRTWSFARGFLAGAALTTAVLWVVERYDLFGA